MGKLTHFDNRGNAVMVDVTDKEITERVAVAAGRIAVNEEVYASDLIPMCHPLMLTKVTVDFAYEDEKRQIKCICTAKLSGKTGVEMEALTGVSVALLTIYDMCKALDRSMRISDIHLVEKTGGKSGHFIAETSS